MTAIQGVSDASLIRTPADLGLDTKIRCWARWESHEASERDEFREFYEDVVRLHDGEIDVAEDSEWAVEVHYTLPLRAYLEWDGKNEYDTNDVVDSIAEAAPEAGIEYRCTGSALLIRKAFFDRIAELAVSLETSAQ